jgi:hypothetical protein
MLNMTPLHQVCSRSKSGFAGWPELHAQFLAKLRGIDMLATTDLRKPGSDPSFVLFIPQYQTRGFSPHDPPLL